MTAAAADVRDSSKWRKVIGVQNAGNLSRCLSHHRFIEKAGGFRIVAEILPVTAGDDFFLDGFPRPQGIAEVFKSPPIHRQTDHSDERSHRLRMIRSQQARGRRVSPCAIASLKDSLSGKNTK